MRARAVPASFAAVLAGVALASCGGGGETGTGPSGPQRGIKGELPGKEAAGSAHLSRGACSALATAVERRQPGEVRRTAEPSPPLSHCRIRTKNGVAVNVYLDVGFAAHQRYENRMEEIVQFGVSDPSRVPHPVPRVGEAAAGNHDANWVPAEQTLYAVRGNRLVTVSVAVPGLSQARLRDEAALLARYAFRLSSAAS